MNYEVNYSKVFKDTPVDELKIVDKEGNLLYVNYSPDKISADFDGENGCLIITVKNEETLQNVNVNAVELADTLAEDELRSFVSRTNRRQYEDVVYNEGSGNNLTLKHQYQEMYDEIYDVFYEKILNHQIK